MTRRRLASGPRQPNVLRRAAITVWGMVTRIVIVVVKVEVTIQFEVKVKVTVTVTVTVTVLCTGPCYPILPLWNPTLPCGTPYQYCPVAPHAVL